MFSRGGFVRERTFAGAPAAADEAGRARFIARVYNMVFLSLAFATLGALVSMSSPGIALGGMLWVLIIAEFALIFVIHAVANVPVLNLAALFVFTFITGLTLGPLLLAFASVNGYGPILQAFGTTAVIFGALAAFVTTTKKDLRWLGNYLFVGLFALIIWGLAGLFFNMGGVPPLIGVLLFSGFILFDVSRLVHQFREDEYVVATLSLYLDFLNLFLFVLQFFGGRRD